jgi:hypothetical protein
LLDKIVTARDGRRNVPAAKGQHVYGQGDERGGGSIHTQPSRDLAPHKLFVELFDRELIAAHSTTSPVLAHFAVEPVKVPKVRDDLSHHSSGGAELPWLAALVLVPGAPNEVVVRHEYRTGCVVLQLFGEGVGQPIEPLDERPDGSVVALNVAGTR